MKYEKFIDEKITLIAKEGVVLDVGGGERFTKWLSKYKIFSLILTIALWITTSLLGLM